MFDNRAIIIHILSFYSSYAFITFEDFLKKNCTVLYFFLKIFFAFGKKKSTIQIYPLVVGKKIVPPPSTNSCARHCLEGIDTYPRLMRHQHQKGGKWSEIRA